MRSGHGDDAQRETRNMGFVCGSMILIMPSLQPFPWKPFRRQSHEGKEDSQVDETL